MPEEHQTQPHRVRVRVTQALSLVEDVAYVGLGLVLTLVAFSLLFSALKSVLKTVAGGDAGAQIVGLLDQVLLTLLVIELLYTVQVSFREHGLIAEPFLVVSLIAVIRRVLVLTAEVPKLPESGEIVFRHAMIELTLLTAMIIVLVASLIALQRHSKRDVEAAQ